MANYIYTPSSNPQAETVVLLPGVNCGAWFFESALPYFLPHFHVVRFNNPGIGGMPVEGFQTVGEMAWKTIRELEALGVNKMHVVGHSLGGFHAQEIAIAVPDRVDRLVLMSTGYGQPHTAKDMLVLTRRAGKTWNGFNREVVKNPVEGLKVVFGDRFVQEEPEAYKAFIQLRSEHLPSKAAAALHVAMGGTFTSRGRLEQITAPTLAVHGTEDPLITLEHAEETVRKIPNATLLRLKGVGHFPMLEEPTTYPRVIDFLLGNAVGATVAPLRHQPMPAGVEWVMNKMKGAIHG